jgi:hypothetical protein
MSSRFAEIEYDVVLKDCRGMPTNGVRAERKIVDLNSRKLPGTASVVRYLSDSEACSHFPSPSR